MKSDVMLDLVAAAQRIGLAVDTLRHWRWRFRSGLRLSPEAQSFARIIRQHGTCLRIAESDLEDWLRCQSRGFRGIASDSSVAELAERIREARTLARANGFDLCAEALDLAGRLIRGRDKVL